MSETESVSELLFLSMSLQMVYITVFLTIIFALITEPSCHFFKTLNTKLKTIIVCNTGCPMFKTFHIVFISLKKPCIWFKILIIMKYHRNITLDHPNTIYPYIHCLVVSTIMRYICSEHMMPVSLLFYTFMHHCNRLERKVQTLESLIKM